MRKFFISLLSMLSLGISGVWAENATTLYERTLSGDNAWAETDASAWGSTFTVTEGTGLTYTGSNTSFDGTMSLSPASTTSKITLSATLHNGAAPGRSGSYDYITIGGVSLQLNSQDKVASLVVDGTSTTLTGYTRDADYKVTFIIDCAKGDVSYNITGGITASGTSKTTTAISSVSVGHYKAGREGYSVTVTLKDISVTEEKQTVSIADYTINYNYKENGTTSTLKTETSSIAVGATVSATSPIIIDGQRYYIKDGETSSMTIGSSNNTLNVELRKANVYNYTVKTSTKLDLASGSYTEGDDAVSVAYPRYINVDGTLYSKDADNKEYNYYFTPNADNQSDTLKYAATEITDVVYFKEAEDIEGLTIATGSPLNIRCSYSKGGYPAEATTVTSLAAGKYKLVSAAAGNSGATFTFKAGESTIAEISTTGSWLDNTSDEFELSAATDITVEQTGASSTKALDYIYIIKTGDVEVTPEPTPVTETITYANAGTLCYDYDAEVESGEVYEFTGVYNGYIYGEKTNEVKAGKPYIVLGNVALTHSSDAVAATAGTNYNGFYGIAGGDEAFTCTDNSYMVFYQGSLWYADNSTCSKGHGYFVASEIPTGEPASSAKRLFGLNSTTGINAISAAQNADAPVYNIAGQRVSKAQKGIFIANGKKVVVK